MAGEPFLFASAGITLASAALYARVADRTIARGGGSLHAALFATWWTGLAIALATQGMAALVLAFGLVHVTMQLFVVHATMYAMIIGTWGLMYSLLWLLTGGRFVLPLVTVWHVGIAAAFAAGLATMEPTDVVAAGWGARIVYDHVNPAMPFVLAALFVPPAIAAVLCLFGARRIREIESRRRLAATSLAVLILFVLAILVEIPASDSAPWSSLAIVGIGGAAALMVLAFRAKLPAVPAPG